MKRTSTSIDTYLWAAFAIVLTSVATAPADSAVADVEVAFRTAEKHGRQANEQFIRCRRFVEGWLNQADPQTGLIPRNLNRDRDIWNAQDAAADNYPFMVLTAALTDRPLFAGRMLEMLRTETRLTSRVDRLPDTWSFSKQAFATENPDMSSIIFGSSEYVKDGLLPLTEWLGVSPWSERMLGIVDDIWKHAAVETPYGMIPSRNGEVNGEMLQALSRIYWMTGDEKYLRYAIRLGDYYLLGENHPTRNFETLRLRDHGCEITSGLAELYVAVHFAAPEKKAAYRGPIHAMFDCILAAGRDERGMLYNSFQPQTGEHDSRICDTWGYNYNGIYSVYLVDQTEAYRQSVRRVLGNLKQHLTTYHWGSADEYADSIEGALNLYNREPVAAAAEWIDSEITDMWSGQKPDGIIEGWHGDGNSARTAIMYALWKTQGLTVRSWRDDLRFGAVREGEALYVSIVAKQAFKGKLLFDKQRHERQMHLPLDYPRINQFPEWFTTDAKQRYVVRQVADNSSVTFTGEQLQAGMPLNLQPGVELRLVVTPEHADESAEGVVSNQRQNPRLQWWREARFGMFVHWGPVSLKGTEIGWSRGAQVPTQEYDQLYKQFNPKEFDADQWVAAAKAAGMRYLVFTSKHHDGFCMWDSSFTDYDIMATPFARDVLEELADACHRQDIKLCTYHSICDWKHPDYPLGSPGGRSKKPTPNISRYYGYLTNQTNEILEKYGPLGVMWFDGEWEAPWTRQHGNQLYRELLKRQPSLIINNRVSKGRQGMTGTTEQSELNFGDYDTPEQRIGEFNRERPWETCMTICRQWSWKPNDEMKSRKECIQTLIRTVGGDGNLLLNVGPMPDGRIEPRQVERLKEIGEWLSKYGTGIYGTRGGPFKPGIWGESTCRSNKIHLFVMSWPPAGQLQLPPISNKVVGWTALSGGSVTVKQTSQAVIVDCPSDDRNDIATVIELTIDGDAVGMKPM